MKTLTAKQVAQKIDASESTARRLIKEIKDYYGVKSKKITENHLLDYLGL